VHLQSISARLGQIKGAGIHEAVWTVDELLTMAGRALRHRVLMQFRTTGAATTQNGCTRDRTQREGVISAT
jgi:hypothetical protein